MPTLTPPPAAPTPAQSARPAANAFTLPPAASAKAPPAQPPRQQQAFAVNPPSQFSQSANGGGDSAKTPIASAPAAAPPEEKTKIASLPKPEAAGPQPAAEVDKGAIHADVARDLQRELARVGCSVGRVDGNWGPRSKAALREFDHYARLSLDPDVPSEDAVAVVQKHRGRVCPAAAERSPRKPEAVRAHEKSPRIAGEPATPKKDWRSISPLCQSPYLLGGRVCCTYDPPNGAPRIICP